MLVGESFQGEHVGTTGEHLHMMLKKTRLLTRQLWRIEAHRSVSKAVATERRRRSTALRVSRLPLRWMLANRKSPRTLPFSEILIWSVVGLGYARSIYKKRPVLACQGWAGEKSNCFRILLVNRTHHEYIYGMAAATE